jgi:hypothetical protein
VSPQLFSLEDAGAYCAALTLGGYDDWILPQRIELASIVSYARQSPAIDTDAFPDTPPEGFWSGSIYAADPSSAWYVSFMYGGVAAFDVSGAFRARCVRRAEPLP